MRKGNIITVTLFAAFIIILISFGKFSFAEKFDWPLFIVSISLNLVALCVDINLIKRLDNHDDVMREKHELYKILEKKKDRLQDVVNNVRNSRNESLICSIWLYCSEMDGKYTFEFIKESVEKQSLIDELKSDGIKKNKLRRVERLLKKYNYTNDIEEIVRKYRAQELVKKENVNIIASVFAVVGFIMAIFAFFKFDYQSINISGTLVIVFVIFILDVFGSCEHYVREKKEKITYYKKLQDVFEYEKITRY